MRGGYVPWFLYLFIFWFLFGAVSVATGVLFSALGLPQALSGLAALILLGVGAFLFIRGYPVKTYVFGGLVFVGVICVMALIRGATVSEPDTPQGVPEGALEPYFVSDDGFGFPYFQFDNLIDLDENPAGFDPFDSSGVGVSIEIGRVITQGSQWALVDNSVQVFGLPRHQVATQTVAADYDGFLLRDNAAIVETPVYVDLFPNIVQLLERGQTFEVTVIADVVYPGQGGTIEQETLTRDLTLFAPPADTTSYADSYQSYDQARQIMETFPTAIGLGVIILASVAGSGYLVYDGALVRPVGGGFGLQMVVRRLSGLQKLGLEAHSLSTISEDSRQGRTEGVFVGVVNAQSPAGRADIRSSDVIISFDGKAINSPKALERAAAKFERGETAEVIVVRFEREMSITVKF